MERKQGPAGPPRWSVVLMIGLLVTPAALTAQDRWTDEVSALRDQAAAIRASADSLAKVQAIPWAADVFEGFRLAKAENRPVFLYTIVGDPLDDC